MAASLQCYGHDRRDDAGKSNPPGHQNGCDKKYNIACEEQRYKDDVKQKIGPRLMIARIALPLPIEEFKKSHYRRFLKLSLCI